MIFSINEILTQEELEKLSNHKYASSGSSLLDPILEPYWNWLVAKFPLWIAPNLITVSGLIITIITTLILVYHSPDARQEPPTWTFVLCAVGVFAYQSLDACDGKQARRTGSSTPLGELFDHGCDCISFALDTVGACIAVRLGAYSNCMLALCCCATGLFYCAHWRTYVYGVLNFSKIDVTELECSCVVVYLTSAWFGTDIWQTPVPLLKIEFPIIPVLIVACVALVKGFGDISVVYKRGAGKKELSPILPLLIVITVAFTIYQKSTENIYENHPCLYMIAFGIVMAKITVKLIVAKMTESEIDYIDSILIGPGLMFLNRLCTKFCLKEYIVLGLFLVYSAADFFHYSTIICIQICDFMNIQLFKITPRTY